MADLTSGTIPIATGTHQVDDGPLSLVTGDTLILALDDGEAVEPATSDPLAITYNFDAFNAVSLWNNVEDGAGFYFHQKITGGTYANILSVYGRAGLPAAADLTNVDEPTSVIRLVAKSTYCTVAGSAMPIVFDHNGGFAFADLPTADVGVGATALCTNLLAPVVGAVAVGGGVVNGIVAHNVAASWTVIAILAA